MRLSRQSVASWPWSWRGLSGGFCRREYPARTLCQTGAVADKTAVQDKSKTYRARQQAPLRQVLLQIGQDCDACDPQQVHDAADKEQKHQRPAASDTIEAMADAKCESALRIAFKAALSLDEEQGRPALGKTPLLPFCP